MTYDIEARVRRNIRNLTIAVVAAAIVIASAITATVVWVNHHTSHRAVPLRSSSVLPSDEELRNTPAAVSTEQLADIEWKELKTTGIWLPISSEAGPKHLSNIHSGFAHTPLGAALAEIHISVLAGMYAGSDVFEPTIKTQLTGVDKYKILAQVESDYQQELRSSGGRPGDAIAAPSLQLSGILIEHYDPGYSAIHLLVKRQKDGVTDYLDARFEVRWINGDWKLVAPLNADWASTISTPQSINKYALLPERK